MRAIGYTRVSTREQATGGVSLEAQERMLRDDAERRGWDLVGVYSDVASGKTTRGRNGLEAALEAVREGRAEALLVSKLDRLSRDVEDFAGILKRFTAKGWGLIVLDLGIDTSTPEGEAHAHMVSTFAMFERKRIGQRTKEALAVKRAQGVQLGRPRELDARIRDEIVSRCQAGEAYAAVARDLEARGIKTARGGDKWHAKVIRQVALAA